jgi:hypothetical protein
MDCGLEGLGKIYYNTNLATCYKKTGPISSGSVWERSLTEFILRFFIEGFEMTSLLFSCHSESFGGTQDKLGEESFSIED